MSAQNPTQKTKFDSAATERRGKSTVNPTKDDDSPGRRSARLATQVDNFVKPKWKTLLEAKQNLTDRESAVKYLTESGYIEETMSISLDHLSYALMLFSAATNLRVLQEGARAIAILLRETIDNSRDELIEEILEEKLTPAVSQLIEVKEELESTVRQIKDTNLMLRQEATYASVTATATATKRMAETRGSPTDIKRRQILIEQEGEYPNTLTKLTEEQLVAKGNEAVRIAKIGGEGECKIISAKKLQRGEVILELNSIEAANTIRHEKAEFCKSFSPTAQLKERNYTVKLNFVPVTHDINSEWERQRIEERSGLQQGHLATTAWIKPVNQRRDNQEVATLIVRFKSPESANKAIKDGMIIQGKRVRGNKMTNGPIRCFHCQRYGHFATNCPQRQDPTKCPQCAGPHRREDCNEEKKQEFKCANCKKKGHAAWDTRCEIYRDQFEQMIRKNEEIKYRFYLTNEEWTWEKDPVYEVSEEQEFETEKESAGDVEDSEREEGEVEEGWKTVQMRKKKRVTTTALTQTTLEGFARRKNNEESIGDEDEEAND